MNTAEIIAGMNGGKATTEVRKVGTGPNAVAMTVTRTAPAVKVVDETEPVEARGSFTKPVDTGKRKVDILPGLTLWLYSRHYAVLEQKGKSYTGAKTTLRQVLYRDDVKHLIDTLAKECTAVKTYEEAHAGEATA